MCGAGNQAQNLCLTCAVDGAVRLWNVDHENKKAVLSQRWPRDARYISGSNEPLQIAIRNYSRWQPAANLDLM